MQTATGGEPVITVRGLVKSYSGVRVVDGIDLDVGRGECVAVLGPNGAGKTTAVEILEGFRSRDAGTVEVLGSDPAAAGRSWRARVGVVAQSDLGASDLTVTETLDHFARYHADPRDTGELVDAVGLTGQARTRVPVLSGGQRRRVDVALAVQGRPELVFLDEPTTGFDPAARRQFWELVGQLQDGGTTIVLTTHYLDEAAHLADRVVVVAGGRVLEVAQPHALGGGLALAATVRWSLDGVTHEEVTATPTAVVRRLLAEHPCGEVPELSVGRPSLEDVYLAILERAGDGRR